MSQHSKIRRRLARLIRCVLVFAVAGLPGTVKAGQPKNTLPIWNLGQGDQFIVRTMVVRKSTVQIGDLPQQIRTLTEEFDAGYLVLDTSRAGDTRLRVEISPVRRDSQPADDLQDAVAERRMPLLRGLELQLVVGADGIVRDVFGHREALARLAGPEPQSRELLLAACPEDTVQSWIADPFWMAPAAAEMKAGTSWERIDERSLGLLGRLQTTVTLTVDELDNDQATIGIQGTSRHVIAPETASRQVSPRIRFSDVTVKINDFAGTGVLRFAERTDPAANDGGSPDNEENREADFPSKPRPWFEEITLQLSYSGSASLEPGEQTLPLSFTSEETRSSKLLQYHTQRPSLDVPNIQERLR